MAISPIWPFIFTDPKWRDMPVFEELIRHEAIHMRQQLELLIVGYYLLYVAEYLYARRIRKLDKRQSYYFTAAEQEAHRNAMNPGYLEMRKPFAIFNYMRHKKWLGRASSGELIVRDY